MKRTKVFFDARYDSEKATGAWAAMILDADAYKDGGDNIVYRGITKNATISETIKEGIEVVGGVLAENKKKIMLHLRYEIWLAMLNANGCDYTEKIFETKAFRGCEVYFADGKVPYDRQVATIAREALTTI